MDSSVENALFLLPGYELDGFPKALPNEEADKFLSGWLALWHPSLVAKINTCPNWHQAESLPSDLAGTLVVVPEVANDAIHEGFVEASDQGEIEIFYPVSNWRESQRLALKAAGIESPQGESAIAEELVVEFAALGYAYIQIQLMTRQLRYTSNLDQIVFSDQLCQAAEAAISGNKEKAFAMLQSCFDALGQERDHYYSLDVSLLDVTLLAETTLGKSLGTQLAKGPLTTYLASASLLAQMPAEHLAALREQTQSKVADIAGGLDAERPHPLMRRESAIREHLAGRSKYTELGFVPPSVFGRLTFGLDCDSVADLQRLGYKGALLVAWSGGSYPEGGQTKMSWEASDGTHLSAIGTGVLDAANAGSFLALGWEIGEALDHEHVPTVVFAHWPNQQCDFYDLLQIVSKRTPALGNWTTASQYFEETDEPYHQERLGAAGFRYPWLSSAESAQEFIHAVQAYHKVANRCRSLQNLSLLAWQLENPPRPSRSVVKQVASSEADANAEGAATKGDAAVGDAAEGTQAVGAEPSATEEQDLVNSLAMNQVEPELAKLQSVADQMLDIPSTTVAKSKAALESAEELEKAILTRLSKSLTGKSLAAPKDSSQEPNGFLVVNPRSAPMRTRVLTAEGAEFLDQDWKFASGPVGHDRFTSIDLPSLGFVTAPLSSSSSKQRSKQPVLAESGGLVQNEFLEVQVDTRRGHLKSLHVPARRGNRLSMMVARRDKHGKKDFQYSEMVASDVRMLTSSNMCGLVRATGRLMLDRNKVGDFEIDYEVWRGSRILEVAIRLKNLEPPQDANPWRSAYVLRLAWPMEAAIVRSFSAGRRQAWASGQAVSPDLIEIDETDYKTHYLPAGLAFHRRTDTRFLETVLSADGRDVEHRIGLGVDLPNAQLSACDFYDQRYALPLFGEGLLPAKGWLINADVRNVAVNIETPLVDASERVVGLRIGLIETDGRSTSARVRLMHNVREARRVNHLGESPSKLTTKEDAVVIALRANEQCCVDVLWE